MDAQRIGICNVFHLAKWLPPGWAIPVYWPSVEIGLEISRKLFHRGIPLLGFLPERGLQDEFQIAFQFRRQMAGPGGLWRLARQQTMQYRAQRVDIAADPHYTPAGLFWTGVIRSEHTQMSSGGIAPDIQQFCDTEIQELGFAELGYQDIVGLQIAVDHEVPVQIPDCPAYLQEQLDPVPHTQPKTAHAPQAKDPRVDGTAPLLWDSSRPQLRHLGVIVQLILRAQQPLFKNFTSAE